MRTSARRWWVLVLTIALSGVLVTAAVPAVGDDAIGANGYVVVELNSPGAAKYTGGIKGLAGTHPQNGRFDPDSPAFEAYKKHLENEHANFRAALGRKAPEAKIVREYYITTNAIAIELNGADPNELGRLNGARRVYDSGLYRPTMNESVNLIDAPAAWGNVGGQPKAGLGVTVGIIDSGIEPSHPFFDCDVNGSDDGNGKLAFGGVYFSGVTSVPAWAVDALLANDPSVFIYEPHGTHVAGTVGGCVTTIAEGGLFQDEVVSGVAPGATLVDYNVFPAIGAGLVAFGGSAFSHDIAAAIEDAVLDQVDVINMSLGGGVQGPHDFLAEASNGAVAAGVVVVTSAGNNGPGEYTVGSPGSASDVIAVAASTNSRGVIAPIDVPGIGGTITGHSGDFPDFDSATVYTLVDWPSETDNLACSSTSGDVDGYVVLVERGECTFDVKITNAKAAGAVGVIVYTDDRDPGGMASGLDPGDQIPALMIARDPGLALEVLLDSDPDGLIGGVSIDAPTVVPMDADLLAGFSSRGPAPFTGIVKPDVTAPGVNILSSVFGGASWALYDGTSMASPHVAGAAAILLQFHDSMSPADVKSALVTTASSLEGYEVWEVGTGKVDVAEALGASVFFSPTNASFGIFEGKKPVSGTVVIDVTGSCNDPAWLSGDGFVSAALSVDGDLVVTLNGGRDIGTGIHSGIVPVQCGGQMHSIPYLAVVDRKG